MSTYIIVGGVAGGATAAARLRRNDENANIIILERGKYVSFANCGIPYFIGEVITERDALLVSTPQKLRSEFNLDVRTGQEVVGINRQTKEVQVRDLAGTAGAYSLHYDKLVLAPGAKPMVPPIPGINLPGVFRLRDIPDMDVIKAKVNTQGAKTAIVIGGGFIGLEMAENLQKLGLSVALVEMLDQVLTPLDFEMAALVHRHLREKGIRLALGDGLRLIEQTAQQLTATLASGKRVQADMVVLAIGVTPENTLAKESALELGARGHVVVNEHMQTSDHDIYAVGDVVQVLNPVTHQATAIPLAGPANRQARIAADHISGKKSSYRGTLGTSIVKVFDLVVATTGLNSRALQSQQAAFLSSVTHSLDHVAYYPGSTTQSIKLLYAPGDGKLLGAQVVGYNAVDRTIDVLSTALQSGLTVYDLEHLELAYAPPFGSAKDPVNVAGYVAGNRLRGETQLIEWKDLAKLDPAEYGVLDVRTDPEWSLGHIPGAIHITNSALRSRIDELDRNKTWIVYCKVGRRAYVMERMLSQHGFKVVNLAGGWTTYEAAREPQSSPELDLAAPQPTAQEDVTVQATEPCAAPVITVHLDARGLQCPGPIMQVFQRMEGMQTGEVLEVLASDPGFRRDASAWAENTGNALLELSDKNGTIRALFRKGEVRSMPSLACTTPAANAKNILVFSADLDHVMAAFTIANGALAMGQHVSMFFTFWGLNVLRRSKNDHIKKTLIERMFGWMMPRGIDALKLSQLNMAGIGTAMMKGVMKSKHIDQLPFLVKSAIDGGARLIACQMTMEMMGIKEEELIEGVELGGVATFINEADKASASIVL
jgi:NADPH-dependent 2,4-dienoyl-CoA reductase/sulfur reductase-like enzyme/peroxiredoxin family protein/TusA-related sulfurtransferase/rhodanese-related sulfurtransferase